MLSGWSSVDADVVVVGGGNAGFSAARAAAERGGRTLILEKGSDSAGGNSHFTAGATRIDDDGLDDLLDVIEPDDRDVCVVVPPYSANEYASDLVRVSSGRSDPELTSVLVTQAHDTLLLVARAGPAIPAAVRAAGYKRADGRYVFFGGLHIGNVGGGEASSPATPASPDALGAPSVTRPADDLIREHGRIVGARPRARRADWGPSGVSRARRWRVRC